jgi:chemotaxis response regulator CheB
MDHSVMKTLIVDDEPIARRVLREELEAVPQVLIVGEAENGKQALEQIGALKPDLVLPIPDARYGRLRGGSKNWAGAACPVIVIVTAFDQHAIEASKPARRLLAEAGRRRAAPKGRGARSKAAQESSGVANDVANITSAAFRAIRAAAERSWEKTPESICSGCERDPGVSSRGRARMDRHRPQKAPGDSNLARDRKSSQGTAVPASAPQRDCEREPRPEDERAKQSALAGDSQ